MTSKQCQHHILTSSQGPPHLPLLPPSHVIINTLSLRKNHLPHIKITLQTRGEADSVAGLRAAMLSLFYLNNGLQQSLHCQLSPVLSPALQPATTTKTQGLVPPHQPPARARHPAGTYDGPKCPAFVLGEEDHIAFSRTHVAPPQTEPAAMQIKVPLINSSG